MYKVVINDKLSGSRSPDDGELKLLDIQQDSSGSFHIIYKNKTYSVHVLEFNPAEKTIVLLINGNRYKVSLEDQYDVLLKSMGMGSNSSKKLKHLKAPMPGLVLDVLINAGDEVKKDAPLIVLEAMKMENVIKSPGEAKVSSVEVSKGAAVEKNEVLIHFE